MEGRRAGPGDFDSEPVLLVARSASAAPLRGKAYAKMLVGPAY
jgi:hypothetical protein